jgi:hypothetical protein
MNQLMDLHEGDEIAEISNERLDYQQRIGTIKKIVSRMDLLLLDDNTRYNLSDGLGRIGNEDRRLAPLTPELRQELENERDRPHKIERLQNMQWEDLDNEALSEILAIIDYVLSLPPIAQARNYNDH